MCVSNGDREKKKIKNITKRLVFLSLFIFVIDEGGEEKRGERERGEQKFFFSSLMVQKKESSVQSRFR
jgi:hypothetical protein